MKPHTCEIVREIINKTNCPERPKQPGNPGYSWILVVRLLVYAIIKGVYSNKGLHTHLTNNPDIAKQLGFTKIPNRTTISRWRRKHWILTKVIKALGLLVQKLIPSSLVIPDSTPIEDKTDPDAKKGKTSRGWFEGFKIHFVSNQLRIPLNAKFTTGNIQDTNQLPELIDGLTGTYLPADKGYDSEANRQQCKKQGITPVIARNKRRLKQKPKRPRYYLIYKKFRYLIEQANSLLKTEILKRYWYNVKGFDKKATLVLTGILAIQVMGVYGLLNGIENPLRISLYRY